ncbi:MAG: hypothetical protein IPO90_12710 [Flavobacteriales bacterium]|nr:hypothetical protein [Flavobacteriales bacterium]
MPFNFSATTPTKAMYAELDPDGFGKYEERAWGVPGRWRENEARLRLISVSGATMHFTFSDLMDGVTDASVEQRAGDPRTVDSSIRV